MIGDSGLCASKVAFLSAALFLTEGFIDCTLGTKFSRHPVDVMLSFYATPSAPMSRVTDNKLWVLPELKDRTSVIGPLNRKVWFRAEDLKIVMFRFVMITDCWDWVKLW